MMRQGKVKEAEPLARAIVTDSIRIRGADNPDTLVTRQHWVTALSMLGENRRALEESGPLLAALERRFGSDHRFTLAMHSTRFESFAALGRYDEAAAEAKIVWDGAAAQAGPRSHQALVGQNDYASALCQTGKRRAALPILEDAVSRARQAFGRDYGLTQTIQFYVGECDLANRRFSDAERAFASVNPKKVAELTGRPDFDATLKAARAEAMLGLGDRERARMLLRAAEAAAAASDDPELEERLKRLQLGLKD